MLTSTLLIVIFATCANAACGFPNGTETEIHWWQAPGTGNVTFTEVIPQDADGKLEYPIQLRKPLYVLTALDNEEAVLAAGDLLMSIKLYQYGGFLSCSWSEVPTFGLLSNLNACAHGVPCPVAMGMGNIKVTLDFSKYSAIIALLKNDSPYQIELTLKSKSSGHAVTLLAQARSLTKL